jgi:hypothetical protein
MATRRGYGNVRGMEPQMNADERGYLRLFACTCGYIIYGIGLDPRGEPEDKRGVASAG